MQNRRPRVQRKLNAVESRLERQLRKAQITNLLRFSRTVIVTDNDIHRLHPDFVEARRREAHCFRVVHRLVDILNRSMIRSYYYTRSIPFARMF